MLVAQDEMSTFTSLSPLTIGIASNVLQFSLSQRRALAISITSPRQLVESKGTVLSIHTSPPPAPPRGREEREVGSVKGGA